MSNLENKKMSFEEFIEEDNKLNPSVEEDWDFGFGEEIQEQKTVVKSIVSEKASISLSRAVSGHYQVKIEGKSSADEIQTIMDFQNPNTGKKFFKWSVEDKAFLSYVIASEKNVDSISSFLFKAKKNFKVDDTYSFIELLNKEKDKAKIKKEKIEAKKAKIEAREDAKEERIKEAENIISRKESIYSLSLEKSLAEYKGSEVYEKMMNSFNTPSAEYIVAKSIQEYVKVNQNDSLVYMYKPNSGMFEKYENEGVVKKIMEREFGFKNITPSFIGNVHKLITAEVSADNEYETRFDKEYIVMKVKDYNNKIAFIHLKIETVGDTYKFRVYGKSIEHKAQQFFEGTLDAKQIKGEKEFTVDFYNSLENQYQYFKENVYTYEPRDILSDECKGTLLQYFLKTSVVNEDTIKHLRNHSGSFFSNRKYQKTPILIDAGRTGKSQLIKAFSHMHHSGFKSFDLTTSYTFGNESLIGATFAVNNELVQDNGKVNESKLKEITGGDKIQIFRKNKNPIVSSTSNMSLWLVMNKIFPATDTGNSMVKRFDFIMFEKHSDIVIDEIGDKLVYGYDIQQDGLSMRSKDGDMTHILEFCMLGALNIYNSNGKCFSSEMPDYCVALNNKFFKKMMRVREFLDEVPFSVVKEDFTEGYMLADDIKKIYVDFHESLNIDKKFVKSDIVDDIINTLNMKEKEQAKQEKRNPILVKKERKLITVDNVKCKKYIVNITCENMSDEIKLAIALHNRVKNNKELNSRIEKDTSKVKQD